MKKWYQSKILWLNIASAILAVLMLFQETGFDLTADQTRWLMLAIGIVNVFLRMVTSQAIAPIRLK